MTDLNIPGPYFFVSCSLSSDDSARSLTDKDDTRHALAGTLVSSLHRLKDTDNSDGGFFVFGDLSVKTEGIFRLQFTLYEFRETEVVYIKSVTSDPFQVHASKNWPGMQESTFLTRSFSDQGVRLRLRKEPRFRLGARGPASDNYEPRRYRTHNRNKSSTDPIPASQPPQAAQATSQSYPPLHGNLNAEGPVQGEDQGRLQQQTPQHHQQQQSHTTWQAPVSPDTSRKRDYSQSTYSSQPQSSYTSAYPSQSDDTSPIKRSRTDPEHTTQPYGNHPYLMGQDYGGKYYSDPNQTAAFSPYAQQHSQQLYGNAYTSSPITMTPRDPVTNFYAPRRPDTQYPSAASTYDSASSRQSTQQSPVSSFGYAPIYSTMPQAQYTSQQNQYVPQLAQPNPPGRPGGPPASMDLYVGHPDTEQPLRSTGRGSIDVLPPVYGNSAVVNMGITTHGNPQLPQTLAEDPRYSKPMYMYDFKPRVETQPR